MTPNDFDNIAWPTPAPPSRELSESIRRTCTENLTAAKPLQTKNRVLFSIGISGTLFALLLAIGWLRHPPHTAILVALFGALTWGLVQASVLFVGYGRPPGRRATRPLRWAMVLLVPSLFVAHLCAASTSLLTFDGFLTAPRSLRSTVVCGIHALLFGAMASAALFVVWRRTDPISPRLTGALTGLAGGLVGAVALDMTCTSLEAWHLWLGHGATLVALVLGGWFAGRKWLAP